VSALRQSVRCLSVAVPSTMLPRCLRWGREQETNSTCQSQSHVMADGQSASLSWCRAPSGTHDQILIDEHAQIIIPLKLGGCLCLKPKLVQMLFKNSFRTSKRTLHFTITKINRLMLFKEIIAV
jgi:hypothetical protein